MSTELHAFLADWRRVLVASVRAPVPDLTNRQMAVLLTVYLTDPPHTVRALARLLGVHKPVITRALESVPPSPPRSGKRRPCVDPW